MERRRHTVAVIGGGPAGSAAAITLASAGVRTVLLDRAQGDSWKLGETLPPFAMGLLRSLGIRDRFIAASHVGAYGNRSAWGSDDVAEHNFVFDPYGPGWHLDRARFDGMLRGAASGAGAVVRTGERVVRAVRPRAGRVPWQLALEGPGGRSSMMADAVVDAGGRASWLARSQGATRQSCDRLVGAAVRLPVPPGGGRDSTTLVEAAEAGWWYSAVIPGAELVVVYFTDADLLPAPARTSAGFSALLEATTHTRRRAGGSRVAARPRVVSAAGALLEPTAGDHWVAAGDAAASYDPLSSRGISDALASGRSAGRAVLANLAGDAGALRAHDRETRRAFARYLAERAAYYALETRWPQSAFWRRRSPHSTPPQGGFHERPDRVLRHPPGDRHRPRGQQPDRVLPRA